jgi:putative peptidoglycan binding protein
MKPKFLLVALVASAAMNAQANPIAYHGGGGGFHGSAVAHSAPAVHAPMRAGGFSSFHSAPMRAYGGRPLYSGQRYSSFGMRSYRPTAFRRPSIYPNRVTITRSGPYTAATIGQPSQSNRFPRVANYRNPAATSVWNQRNSGSQFRSGNNRLRGDWQKHVFAQGSGDWHRDWDRHSDHWWNGHRCCFLNGSWVIFNIGFDPWWPYSGSYPDYYAYGSPPYGYDPGYYNSGDYQGQMYYDQNGYPDQSQPYYDSGDYQGQMDYDQNSYPDQSQGYYDSTVYQPDAYYDPNGYSDQSQSNYSIVVTAQERLAREGYYHGETDGALSPEMQKAVKRYQITNGLRPTGYLDSETLGVMGLRKGASY